MEACSTLGTTLLETLDVRASSYIESKEKWQLVTWDVKIDEVVLVIGADVPCGQWSLGV